MRVYVIDDDRLVRRMLASMLSGAGIENQGFETPAAFLDALDTLPLGCILLDINFPGRNGLDVLTEILRRQPAFPVVMASGSTDLDDAIRAFRHGAIHFLRKPFRRDDLIAVLHEAERIGAERKAAHDRAALARSIALTTRERQVLDAMMHGLQTKLIAWRLGISVRTIDMHRSNILTKLSARNASQAVAIARRLGLVPDELDPVLAATG